MHRYVHFLAVLFVAACLDACSNWSGDGNAVSRKIERMVVEVWAPSQSARADAMLHQQVELFNETQKNIAVELRLMEHRDYGEAITHAKANNALPGVLALDLRQLADFVDDDVLEPVDKMMSQRLWDDIYPELLEQAHIGTHLYGLPAVHTVNQELVWSVAHSTHDKSATMAFIHYLLHPEQQRAAVAAGYTLPVTYSVAPPGNT